MSGTKRSGSKMEQSAGAPKFVLLISDALIDGRDAIAKTFDTLLATYKPDMEKKPSRPDILATSINCGNDFAKALRELNIKFDTFAEVLKFHERYGELVVTQRVSLYPEAKGFLTQLKKHNIPVMVMVNEPTTILRLLKDESLQDHVDAIGQSLTHYIRNPDGPHQWRQFFLQHLFSWAGEMYREMDPARNVSDTMSLADVTVVSATPNLLNLGKVIDAQTSLVKQFSDQVDQGAPGEHLVVSDLAELGAYWFGSGEVGKAEKKPEGKPEDKSEGKPEGKGEGKVNPEVNRDIVNLVDD